MDDPTRYPRIIDRGIDPDNPENIRDAMARSESAQTKYKVGHLPVFYGTRQTLTCIDQTPTPLQAAFVLR